MKAKEFREGTSDIYFKIREDLRDLFQEDEMRALSALVAVTTVAVLENARDPQLSMNALASAFDDMALRKDKIKKASKRFREGLNQGLHETDQADI